MTALQRLLWALAAFGVGIGVRLCLELAIGVDSRHGHANEVKTSAPDSPAADAELAERTHVRASALERLQRAPADDAPDVDASGLGDSSVDSIDSADASAEFPAFVEGREDYWKARWALMHEFGRDRDYRKLVDGVRVAITDPRSERADEIRYAAEPLGEVTLRRRALAQELPSPLHRGRFAVIAWRLASRFECIAGRQAGTQWRTPSQEAAEIAGRARKTRPGATGRHGTTPLSESAWSELVDLVRVRAVERERTRRRVWKYLYDAGHSQRALIDARTEDVAVFLVHDDTATLIRDGDVAEIDELFSQWRSARRDHLIDMRALLSR